MTLRIIITSNAKHSLTIGNQTAGFPSLAYARKKEDNIMKTEFILDIEHDKTESDLTDSCPWAATFEKADGGWIAFESKDDATTWDAQK